MKKKFLLTAMLGALTLWAPQALRYEELTNEQKNFIGEAHSIGRGALGTMQEMANFFKQDSFDAFLVQCMLVGSAEFQMPDQIEDLIGRIQTEIPQQIERAHGLQATCPGVIAPHFQQLCDAIQSFFPVIPLLRDVQAQVKEEFNQEAIKAAGRHFQAYVDGLNGVFPSQYTAGYNAFLLEGYQINASERGLLERENSPLLAGLVMAPPLDAAERAALAAVHAPAAALAPAVAALKIEVPQHLKATLDEIDRAIQKAPQHATHKYTQAEEIMPIGNLVLERMPTIYGEVLSPGLPVLQRAESLLADLLAFHGVRVGDHDVTNWHGRDLEEWYKRFLGSIAHEEVKGGFTAPLQESLSRVVEDVSRHMFVDAELRHIFPNRSNPFEKHMHALYVLKSLIEFEQTKNPKLFAEPMGPNSVQANLATLTVSLLTTFEGQYKYCFTGCSGRALLMYRDLAHYLANRS